MRCAMRVHTLSLPNPYFEKDNNAYAIELGDGELALVDTGVDRPEAFRALVEGLARLGYAPQAVRFVLLTHKHLDHFGLAHRLKALSGATVYVHAQDLPDVVEFDGRYPRVHDQYAKRLRAWGVPEARIEPLRRTRDVFLKLGRSVPAEPLYDGQTIDLGRVELRALHTPGHTMGSACFLLGDRLFTGDHILPDYTPNVGATDLTAQGALTRYRASLQKLKELDGVRALPGHGRPIPDLNARIDEIVRHHDEREARILRILSDGRPRTVFEIARALFGELREHHVVLGCGEVFAHLEALEAREAVVGLEDGRYARR